MGGAASARASAAGDAHQAGPSGPLPAGSPGGHRVPAGPGARGRRGGARRDHDGVVGDVLRASRACRRHGARRRSRIRAGRAARPPAAPAPRAARWCRPRARCVRGRPPRTPSPSRSRGRDRPGRRGRRRPSGPRCTAGRWSAPARSGAASRRSGRNASRGTLRIASSTAGRARRARQPAPAPCALAPATGPASRPPCPAGSVRPSRTGLGRAARGTHPTPLVGGALEVVTRRPAGASVPHRRRGPGRRAACLARESGLARDWPRTCLGRPHTRRTRPWFETSARGSW
jgi:hypothetical protein